MLRLVTSTTLVPAVTPVPLTSIPPCTFVNEPFNITFGLSVTAPFTVKVFERGWVKKPSNKNLPVCVPAEVSLGSIFLKIYVSVYPPALFTYTLLPEIKLLTFASVVTNKPSSILAVKSVDAIFELTPGSLIVNVVTFVFAFVNCACTAVVLITVFAAMLLDTAIFSLSTT